MAEPGRSDGISNSPSTGLAFSTFSRERRIEAATRALMKRAAEPKTPPAEPDDLRAVNLRLQEELDEMKILLQNTIEHGEAVEDQLAEMNAEIAREKKKAD